LAHRLSQGEKKEAFFDYQEYLRKVGPCFVKSGTVIAFSFCILYVIQTGGFVTESNPHAFRTGTGLGFEFNVATPFKVDFGFPNRLI
jgi:hypothetical protein